MFIKKNLKQTESEDDYVEAMLSVSAPGSGNVLPGFPANGGEAETTMGGCPSCRVRLLAPAGSPSAAMKTGPHCSFNVSTDQESLVRYFMDRQKFSDDGQAVVIEWRQLAAAVDRILFWVFCVMTCVSSALFLLIIPGYNRGWFTSKQF